jgi:hypothetical protein
MPESFAWEAKYEINKSYSPNQDKSFRKELYNLLSRNLVYKLPDGTLQGTPFDGFKLHNTRGYFFIQFHADRKCFYKIDADTMEGWIEDGHNLLSAQDCALIGTKILVK